MRGHGHHGHAVCQAAIDRLQIHVIESFLQHHGGDSVDEISVRDRAMRGNAFLRVFFVFAAEAHDQVSDGLPQEFVLLHVACLQFGEFLFAEFFEIAGLGAQAAGLWRDRRAA